MASLRFLLFSCLVAAATYAEDPIPIEPQQNILAKLEQHQRNNGNVQRGKKDVLLTTAAYPYLLRSISHISPLSLVAPVSPINHILPFYRSVFPYNPNYPYNYGYSYPYYYRK